MNIVPLMRCSDMAKSIAFYTQVLDFEHTGTWPETGTPSYSIFRREGAELHLSAHAGDSVPGAVALVIVSNIDALFRKYLGRSLDITRKPGSPIHGGPLNQTWGTREFYVDDPDGNTIRFVRRGAVP